MRKFAVISALLVIVTALSGCAQIARGRAEIDKLFITRILSIDKTPDGKVMLTLTTKSLQIGGNGGGGQTQKGESVVSEGDTVFEAARNLLIYADRRPHYGHTEYILFGEEIAKEGLLPYLDFISRQYEFRYNAKVYIVRGATANSLVKKTNTQKMFVGDRIASIEESAQNTTLSTTVTLNEALLIFDNKNLATFLPFIEEKKAIIKEGEEEKSDVLLRGYAIFKRDKLFTFTSEEQARGISWIMNRSGSGIIIVKSKAGEKVSLEIIANKAKQIPRIEGNELRCTIEMSITSNIGEIMGTETLLNPESVKYLKTEQEKIVKQILEKTVRLSQENNLDQFSTITKFIFKYPMMRDYFEKNWKDLYPDVKFDFKVDSNIKGTYLLNDPTGSTEKVMGE
ncbi:MAG TPA: Ger(x)C family spore germination protein [Clostridia bacterium]|nr:Ger(x)C family spore germination protein [Clostridia bacterium]